MIEIILALTQTVIIGFLLVFFYKRESISSQKDQETAKLIKEFANEQSYNVSQLVESTFSDYLKHIQKLETINVPKPVTSQMVQDILDRTPVMAEPNQIEEVEDNGIRINEDNMSSIPLNGDTNIMFESDELPTDGL